MSTKIKDQLANLLFRRLQERLDPMTKALLNPSVTKEILHCVADYMIEDIIPPIVDKAENALLKKLGITSPKPESTALKADDFLAELSKI